MELTGRMWARLLASTNQPSFVTNHEALKEKAADINNVDISAQI